MRVLRFAGVVSLLALLFGCAHGPTATERHDWVGTLLVRVPASTHATAEGLFTVRPSVQLTNTTGVPERIRQFGSDLVNVDIQFEVFDADGRKLPVRGTKLLVFHGGGRDLSRDLQPDEIWSWDSDSEYTYAATETSEYRIVAHLILDHLESVSPPFTFHVVRAM